ncbi:hypothetical protein [Fibrobacter sp.]|uniref:hypothetical protein n=1 Tax=Fibrobacter sp. TaxID=35828 RepID=UPI003870858C
MITGTFQLSYILRQLGWAGGVNGDLKSIPPSHEKAVVKENLTVIIFVYYHQQATVAEIRLQAINDLKSRLFVISPVNWAFLYSKGRLFCFLGVKNEEKYAIKSTICKAIARNRNQTLAHTINKIYI